MLNIHVNNVPILFIMSNDTTLHIQARIVYENGLKFSVNNHYYIF